MATKALVPTQGVRTPAKTSAATKNLYEDERRFYTILIEDHKFDIIERYLKLYERVQKSKRLKAYQRLPLEERMLSKILDLCIPKIRAVDDRDLDAGGKVTFNINIDSSDNSDPPMKSAGSGKVKSRKKSSVTSSDGNVTIQLGK